MLQKSGSNLNAFMQRIREEDWPDPASIAGADGEILLAARD